MASGQITAGNPQPFTHLKMGAVVPAFLNASQIENAPHLGGIVNAAMHTTLAKINLAADILTGHKPNG